MGKSSKESWLAKISGWFFINWRFTLLAWMALVIAGGGVYAKVIQREGFPPINFPLSVVQGTYFVDDKDKVDQEVASVSGDLFLELDSVKTVSTTAGGNFFTAVVQFNDGTDAVDGVAQLEAAINGASNIPEQAKFDFSVIDPAGFLNEFDMLLSVYNTGDAGTVEDLEAVSRFVAESVASESYVDYATPQFLIDTGVNPATGEDEQRQTKFNKIGLSQSGDLEFFNAVTVGVDRVKSESDIIQLSDRMKEKLANLDLSQFNKNGNNYEVVIGADYAESITTQISSLQGNLLSGLIAVALVSFLLITWRASIVTGLFMVTVMATTVLVLYFVGYTLNTITLFALVLSLGLFVDDATIVVEAIDSSRSKKRKPLEVIKDSISKIGGASFAGTFTTVLVFLPLAFLTGVLGEFIRLMPITIIIALITSLALSLTVIPLLSRFFLLRHTKESAITRYNPISKLESKGAELAAWLPMLLKTSPTKGKLVAVAMFTMSIVFFMNGLNFASKLDLNIFPPTKDSDQIGFIVNYPEGYSIEQAQEVTDRVDEIVSAEIGEFVRRVTYGSFDQPSARSADALIELTPFNTRDTKSPVLMDKIQTAIDQIVPSGVSVRVMQFDAGPPVEEYPLQIQVLEEDVAKAGVLTQEIQEFLEDAVITRSNGTTANITETKAPQQQFVFRTDGQRSSTVQATFDADDTSALLQSSEKFVKEKFTKDYLESKGFSEESLGFDFGQESENADSFAALAWAFPLALLSMYLLLAVQFRSFLQPLLIFMAIPFTFFGVFGGLYATDNALSFFVQVGMVGLIGIAVNNSILLTDFANQERRAGATAVEAISRAAKRRFRPLVTTTVTTVVALLPLALSDPFWEALAFTIIFGLISSTFLVVFSFPYYYLAAEWMRTRTSRRYWRNRRKNKAAKA